MMKKIYIIPFLFLFSCASSKPNCDAYGKDNFLVEEIKIPIQTDTLLYHDTIIKPPLHTNEIVGIKHLTKK